MAILVLAPDPGELGGPVVSIELDFFVRGVPAPKGSMKAFAWIDKRTRKPRASITHDNKRTAPWSTAVAVTARSQMGPLPPMDGPICLELCFFFNRLASHYSKRGGLLPSAPSQPAVKPDIDKLARLVGDALEGIVYANDSRVTRMTIQKEYAPACRPPGVRIRVIPHYRPAHEYTYPPYIKEQHQNVA